jgi:protein-arginine kinase
LTTNIGGSLVGVAVAVGVRVGVKVAVGGRLVAVGEGVTGVGEAVAVGSTVSVGAKVSTGMGASSVIEELQDVINKRKTAEIRNLTEVYAEYGILISPPCFDNLGIIIHLSEISKIEKYTYAIDQIGNCI